MEDNNKAESNEEMEAAARMRIRGAIQLVKAWVVEHGGDEDTTMVDKIWERLLGCLSNCRIHSAILIHALSSLISSQTHQHQHLRAFLRVFTARHPQPNNSLHLLLLTRAIDSALSLVTNNVWNPQLFVNALTSPPPTPLGLGHMVVMEAYAHALVQHFPFHEEDAREELEILMEPFRLLMLHTPNSHLVKKMHTEWLPGSSASTTTSPLTNTKLLSIFIFRRQQGNPIFPLEEVMEIADEESSIAYGHGMDFVESSSRRKKRKGSKGKSNGDRAAEEEEEEKENENENDGEAKGERSVKRVRFALSQNLEWRPCTPLPPHSLRVPPSATPKGSALKKGVPPGPVYSSLKSPKSKSKKKKEKKSLSPIIWKGSLDSPLSQILQF